MTGKIIAVANGKGGVGKSTHTANLAIGLHHRGYKVALFDSEKSGTTIHLQERGDIDVFPAYDRMIAQSLKIYAEQYDYIIVDTAGVNIASVASVENLQEVINSKILAMSDLVLVPVFPSPIDLRKTMSFLTGLEPLMDATRGQMKSLIFVNCFKANEKVSKQIKAHFENEYSQHEYHRYSGVTIRNSTLVTQADGLYQSIAEYAPSEPVANDFEQLMDVVLKTLESK